ncbi:MAG: helix-turn-helix transcriptional regulator [Clostridia bacterium]|jgi:putative transcriptional regulator|nr:helix-turn-helix transcriptional regulator [Clostridia bacterium]MDY0118899.1 helix-turn-helix transcriptional regulator [Bacilli bacterium]
MFEIRYNKLWKKLIDMNLNKTQLRAMTGIGTGTMAKLSKGEPVGLEIIGKICFALKCNIEEVVEFIYEQN